MKLDDFLKCKKVRAIRNYGQSLTEGKEYMISSVDYISVSDNDGDRACLDSDLFEPVLDSAENPLQGAELTPEFEVAEPVLADNCQANIQDIGTDILDTNADIKDTPKFKVGDKVYFPRLSNKLCVIGEGQEDDYVDEVNGSKALAEMQSDLDFVYSQRIKSWVWNKIDAACPLIHATPENHALLSQLQPHIKFEAPPKPLTGSDLCFEKLRNGKKLVMCAVSDLSDEKAIKRLKDGDTCIRVIKDCDPAPYHFIDVHGIRHGFAVPLNDETGEPLTESVLDE